MSFVKNLRRMYLWVGMFALVIAGISTASIVHAADETPDYRIMASPASLDLDLEPGSTTSKEFTIKNNGAKAFEFTLDVGPYSVVGENYAQDFSTETKYTDLVNWITFSKDGAKLEPGEEAKITVTVAVPDDVPDGGQYAVILAKMIEGIDGESQSAFIAAQKQVGILIYSKNVDGNTRLEGEILENKIASFLFTPPIQATSVVKNDGNVHASAKYTLQVFPLFGDEEVYTNEENPGTRRVMPETQRFNRVTWDGAPKLGIFRVKQTVEFLGETSVKEKVVFLCPIWFLVIILIIIFLAVFWLVNRSRGRKEEE